VLLIAFGVVPAIAYGASAAQNGYSEAGPINQVTESAPTQSAPTQSAPQTGSAAPGSTGERGTAGEAVGSAPSAAVESFGTGSSSSSVLPFTGLDLAIVLLLGVALLGLGLLIRRANRSTSA
jgi:hypothetical protein